MFSVLNVRRDQSESSPPGVKGTFHKGFTENLQTRKFCSRFRTVCEAVLWHETGTITCLYVFLMYFILVLDFCTILEHSNWIETLFAATESKQFFFSCPVRGQRFHHWWSAGSWCDSHVIGCFCPHLSLNDLSWCFQPCCRRMRFWRQLMVRRFLST